MDDGGGESTSSDRNHGALSWWQLMPREASDRASLLTRLRSARSANRIDVNSSANFGLSDSDSTLAHSSPPWSQLHSAEARHGSAL
jgi:Zn-finger domain-containing protein